MAPPHDLLPGAVHPIGARDGDPMDAALGRAGDRVRHLLRLGALTAVELERVLAIASDPCIACPPEHA